MALGQNQKRPALFVYLDNAVVVIDGMTKAGESGFAVSFAALLVRFPIAGRDIRSVNFPRDRGVPLTWCRLEFTGILAGQGDVHELHPDREGGVSSGLFLAERSFFVVTNPDSASERRRKAHEPGVGEVVGRPRLAGQRIRHFGGGNRSAMKYHVP